ncbi:MAG: aldo/keto reductase [Solirubrobacterales bacterium]|nr:aldo/keto reductase [Solirubrobacterales bacterium]
MTASTDQVPLITLPDGASIPQLGFGTWQIPEGEVVEPVTRALLGGYRHIDTAAAYGNEAGVGQAVHAAGLDRGEVFITTKCFNDDHGHQEAKRALKASLSRLEMDYVDLYLIHWPVPSKDRYVETWQAFIELQEEGLTRSIGVCNFNQPHLERLVAETGVKPVLNQIELHPRLQQAGLRREHDDLGIITEAWSPLGKGVTFEEPAVADAAAAHGKTPAQILIRWHLQLGNVVIPKSVTPERIEQNFDVFDFALTPEQMAAFDALEAGERTGPDPDTFVRPGG